MINDVQTHDLPMSSRGLNQISSFMGFKNPLDFKKKVELNLSLVSGITNRFFAPKVHKNRVPENYLKMSDDWLYVPALRSEKAKGIFKKIRPIIIEKAILQVVQK
jgi:glutamine synthetase adenylyltransferase